MFNYQWNIADGYNINPELKVFGTFVCGGGSTMGYKLAGFNHLGGVEIDKQMTAIYQQNHKPKYLYNEDIRNFLNRKDIPDELYNLDILDGSPPCSSFSMSGSREKNWGKKKTFREGQSKQILDDLFFEYIKLAEKLQPKVVIAENVKGLIQGNARAYVSKIVKAFKSAGYIVQLFLLKSDRMGVPQRRERTFFIAKRIDLNYPKLKLDFNIDPIPFSVVDEGNVDRLPIANCDSQYYDKCGEGKSIATVHPKGNRFNSIKVARYKPLNTIASGSELYHPIYKGKLTDTELTKCSTFPLDYNFLNAKPIYVLGMSVPPVMMTQVANQIKTQWLQKTELEKSKAA